MWRLGVPAALMVAFVLVGLTRVPWRGDEARRPATAVTPTRVDAAPAVGVEDHALSAANAAAGDADLRGAPPGSERWVTREAPAPSARLPEEREPLAPDVVVAMEPAWPATGLPPVVMHSHLEGAPDGSPSPALLEGAMAPAGDDAQGPEPGARFWFGPGGLERVKILEEAQR